MNSLIKQLLIIFKYRTILFIIIIFISNYYYTNDFYVYAKTPNKLHDNKSSIINNVDNINNSSYKDPNYKHAKLIIKIAIVVPLTGKYKHYGKNLLIAANQAMQDHNKIQFKNNLPKYQLQLIPFDDQADLELAKNIAYKIIKDHSIKIVIGHFSTDITLATSKIYAKKGLLHIIPTVTNHKVTEQGINTLFRMCGRDDLQAQYISDFIKTKFKDHKIAILHNEETASKLLAEQLQESLARLNIMPTLYQNINFIEFKNYFKIINFIKKIQQLNINLIFFAGNYIDTMHLLKISYRYKLHIPIIIGENALIPEFYNSSNNFKILAGTIMNFHKIAGLQQHNINQHILKKHKKTNQAINKVANIDNNRHNYLVNIKLTSPETMAALTLNQAIFGYAAMQVALATINAYLYNDSNQANHIKSAKNDQHYINGRILANWLHHNKVSTILGKKSWDTNGDIVNAGFKMYIWDEHGNYWSF